MDKQEIDRLGYDLEELYFARLNQKLIAKLRDKLNRARAETNNRNAQTGHWMRCPKCGDKLEEFFIQDIAVDRCGVCRGMFFDAGELALLLHPDNSSALPSLRELLRANGPPSAASTENLSAAAPR